MTAWAVRSAIALLAAPVLLVGCSDPSYTYVKNSSEKTYFKVPRAWSAVNQDEIERALIPDDPESETSAIKRRLLWAVGYDADETASASHLLTPTGKPFVYVSVTRLTATQRDDISLNVLRDYLLPVSLDARKIATAQGFGLSGFELLVDESLTGKGVHGVHEVFNYKFPDGELRTFDQTAYVSNDSSRVYLMLVTCTAHCHRDNLGLFNNVVSSFTIRRAP